MKGQSHIVQQFRDTCNLIIVAIIDDWMVGLARLDFVGIKNSPAI